MALELVALARLLVRGRASGGPFLDYAKPAFLVAFLLIALAFAVTAKAPADLRYIANFIMLAVFVPLSDFFARFAAPPNLGRVALFALLGAIGSFVLALVQTTILHEGRAYGLFSDPIWGAEAILIFGTISAAGYRARVAPVPRGLYLLGPVFAITTTALTGSRGPLLIAPALALIIVVFIGRRARIAALLAFIAAAIAASAVSVASPPLWARFSQGMLDLHSVLTDSSVADSSAGIRLIFWHIGWSAFRASPLFGYGWAHFLQAAYFYLPNHGVGFTDAHPEIRGNIHLHADILDFAVAGGLCGLLAYVLILLGPCIAVFKSLRDSQYEARRMAMILLVVGYAGCGLSYLMFGFEFHTTLYVSAAAILVAYCRDAPPDPGAPGSRQSR